MFGFHFGNAWHADTRVSLLPKTSEELSTFVHYLVKHTVCESARKPQYS